MVVVKQNFRRLYDANYKFSYLILKHAKGSQLLKCQAVKSFTIYKKNLIKIPADLYHDLNLFKENFWCQRKL